ncbi:transducin (beta)-like 1 [Nematocida sp. AWRm80]|nr:transducin (beta)-like 1 [Nematocida sp. AWRm80]
MITLTSTELNYLVYRYLIEEGYTHSAYVFGRESMIEDAVNCPTINRNGLKNYVIKGVEMEYIEKHTDTKNGIRKCISKYSISMEHKCIDKVLEIEPRYLESQNSDVSLCAWAQNGELVTGSQNCILRIWDVPNPKKEWQLGVNQNNSHGITGVAIESDSLFGTPTKGTVVVGTTHSGDLFVSKNNQEWKVSQAHKGPIVSISLKDKELFTGGWDGICRKWETKEDTLQETNSWKLHNGSIMDILMLKKGFVTCSGDSTLCSIDKITNKITKMTGHQNEVNALRHHKETIVSCSDDRTLRLWQFNNPTPLATLTGHTKEIYSIDISNETVASGSFDSTVKLWDITKQKLLSTLESHTKSIYTVAFSKDSTLLASGGLDSIVKLWDTRSNELAKEYYIGAGIYQLEFNPEGSALLVCSSNPRPILLEIRK